MRIISDLELDHMVFSHLNRYKHLERAVLQRADIFHNLYKSNFLYRCCDSEISNMCDIVWYVLRKPKADHLSAIQINLYEGMDSLGCLNYSFYDFDEHSYKYPSVDRIWLYRARPKLVLDLYIMEKCKPGLIA